MPLIMNKMCSEDRYNCASISNETQTFHLKFKQNFKHKSEMSLILLYFYQIDGHLHTGKKPPHSLHHPCTAVLLLLRDQRVILLLIVGLCFSCVSAFVIFNFAKHLNFGKQIQAVNRSVGSG